jgi:hypothetical protein
VFCANDTGDFASWIRGQGRRKKKPRILLRFLPNFVYEMPNRQRTPILSLQILNLMAARQVTTTKTLSRFCASYTSILCLHPSKRMEQLRQKTLILVRLLTRRARGSWVSTISLRNKGQTGSRSSMKMMVRPYSNSQ